MIPPRDATLPKPTVNGLKEKDSRKEEEEQDNNIDEEYLAYLDSITEEEEYAEEANWEDNNEEQEYEKQDLPTSSVKSSKLPQPIVKASVIQELIEQVIEDKDKDLTQLQNFYE